MDAGLLKGEQESAANNLIIGPDADSGDQPIPSAPAKVDYDK